MLRITEKAKEEMKNILDTNEQVKSFRVFLRGFGWGGPKFGVAPGEPSEEDEQLEVEGFSFLLDKKFSRLLSNVVIDVRSNFGENRLTARLSYARGCWHLWTAGAVKNRHSRRSIKFDLPRQP